VDEATIWQAEQEFWLGDIEHFRSRMAPHCLMVFPPPMGILTAEVILDSLRHAPRWETVEMTDRHIGLIGESMLVVAYRAESRRRESPVHRALCSSSYVRLGRDWRLAHHQQTLL
jgi:hypothetical protein